LTGLCTSDTNNKGCNGVIDVNQLKGNFLLI
jgi:hypothetical protein